jgi:hypothetical protein
MAERSGEAGESGGEGRIIGASTTEPFEGAGGPPAAPVSDEEARRVEGGEPTDPTEAANS